MNRSRIVVVGVGVLALVVLGMLANAQGKSGRNLTLLPQAGVPYDIARGSVIITPDFGQFNRFLEYSVQNLVRQHAGSNAYAIYVSTPSLGRVRLRTFNTSQGPHHHFSGFSQVPDEGNPLWNTETITVEVYIEADHGFDAPDVGGLLVLRGVDQP